MSLDVLSAYTREEFAAEVCLFAPDRRIDVTEAERLTRTAHFGIVCAQEPEAEFGYYALQLLGLFEETRIEPAARSIFASFVENGAAPQTDDPYVHQAVAGEELEALAQRFGTSVAAILDANRPLAPAQLLEADARLQIPGNRTYVCQSGDTLESVARELTEYVLCFDERAAVSVEALCRRNSLDASRWLEEGVALAYPFPEPLFT